MGVATSTARSTSWGGINSRPRRILLRLRETMPSAVRRAAAALQWFGRGRSPTRLMSAALRVEDIDGVAPHHGTKRAASRRDGVVCLARADADRRQRGIHAHAAECEAARGRGPAEGAVE